MEPTPSPLLQRAATGAGVKVALVDSGVWGGHPHIAREVPGWGLEEGGTFVPFEGDRHGHGTALAAALLRLAPDVELVSVAVLDGELSCTAWDLILGIRQAIASGAQVIQLALGAENPDYAEAFAEVLDEARDAGAVCVVAAHQRGRSSYPADLAGAIAALGHPECPLERYYRQGASRVLPDGSRERLTRFVLHGYPRSAEGRGRRGNFKGSSVACAHLAAFCARLLELEPELGPDALRARLVELSSGLLPPPGDAL